MSHQFNYAHHALTPVQAHAAEMQQLYSRRLSVQPSTELSHMRYHSKLPRCPSERCRIKS